MQEPIRIRAHHLLCIPRFKDGGYTKEFRRHFRKISKEIRDNPKKKIKVLKQCDDFCIKCPHFEKNSNSCIKRSGINHWILLQDEAVFDELKIKENSLHKIKDIFNLSVNKISSENLKRFCRGCEYLEYCVKYGINNSFMRDIDR